MQTRRLTREEFLDIRNHGFFRVAVVVPRVHLGNTVENARAHYDELKKVYDKGAMYALCPELGLTGYSCKDGFFHNVLLDEARSALETLIKQTQNWDMLITVGMPLRVGGLLFNCAVTFLGGKILAVHGKVYPPSDGEFEELRHFNSILEAMSDSVKLCEQDIPFGTDILIHSEEYPNFVLGVDICQDMWVPIAPGDEAALAGATVLANPSASTAVLEKDEWRRILVAASSGKNSAARMYASCGFGESTMDVSWDGHSIVAERGSILTETELFQIHGTHAITDINLEAIISSRMQDKSFGQNARVHRKDFRHVSFKRVLGTSNHGAYFSFERKIDPNPFVPSDEAKRNERCEYTYKTRVTGLANHLLSLPKDMRKVVIGVSGGSDSTEALLVCVRAMDLIGEPRTNIIAITMPCFGTTDRTYKNACGLANALGVTLLKIPITSIVKEIFRAIGHSEEDEGLAFENAQAWTRKLVELAVACKERGVDIGTGDLSELMLGWCTMFGDHAGHYGVNSGVAKTLIKYLIRWEADVVFKDEMEVRRYLLDILDTPISPELKRHNQGQIKQITENEIGPYELHDFFASYFKRFGLPPRTIARLAYEAFQGKYSISAIKRWLELFLIRFQRSQIKRNVLPLGVKTGTVAVSPRGDLRWPPDMSSQIWLDDLRKVPDKL